MRIRSKKISTWQLIISNKNPAFCLFQGYYFTLQLHSYYDESKMIYHIIAES